ncbi:MAG TPA: hypothetical protein VFQ30_19360 [Ktedonobacteraceae bacterium]|nr:hypothetical protein [Ktedonobacteraceae bacterium]
MIRLLVNAAIVLVFLIVFSYIGAIVFPGLPAASASVGDIGRNFLLLLLPVGLMSLMGYLLGRGIRSVKNSFESLGLTYVSAFMIGGVLALLTVLNFGYSAHINFNWLGEAWYDRLLTIFLIGAPITLAFLA